MKIQSIHIHNYKSIVDERFSLQDYSMLVGSNNAGKSNIINAIRVFYDKIKYSYETDFPKVGAIDADSWIDITYLLSDEELLVIKDSYRSDEKILTVRKYLKSTSEANRVKANQSNLYAVINGIPEENLFYGARNISTAKLGDVVYIPALTTAGEQMKMTGTSPLRDVINLVIKKRLPKISAYQNLLTAFQELDTEAKNENGFMKDITSPINSALANWNINLALNINPMDPEEISKNLIKPLFKDINLPDGSFDIDKFGHGFQRSVIYELIALASSFREEDTQEQEGEKKEFNPDFTLILFEEPEAFLHPTQQESLGKKLRRLSKDPETQVLITSHSPIFIGKASYNLLQISHIKKEGGITKIYNPNKSEIQSIFDDAGDFRRVLQLFVDDDSINESKKTKARSLLTGSISEEEREQFERFNFQLWLDSDRSSAFFSERILIVEGATERAVINFLLENDWIDLDQYKIFVLDSLGKYNIHRFIDFFEKFGLSYGAILDSDEDKDHHVIVNELIKNRVGSRKLAPPYLFPKDLETFLGITIPGRPDQKPVSALRKLVNGEIGADKLLLLKEVVCNALGITIQEP